VFAPSKKRRKRHRNLDYPKAVPRGKRFKELNGGQQFNRKYKVQYSIEGNATTAKKITAKKSGPTWARTKDHLIMSQVL
jgi:hypothetical protein